MEENMKRGQGVGNIGPTMLISITVLVPLARWAQVAWTHYSCPHGLSFMGKGKYGLYQHNPCRATVCSIYVSYSMWEAATKEQPGKRRKSELQLVKKKLDSTVRLSFLFQNSNLQFPLKILKAIKARQNKPTLYNISLPPSYKPNYAECVNIEWYRVGGKQTTQR